MYSFSILALPLWVGMGEADNYYIAMKKIVFLTGAGMSVESGFKTFRGNDGLWENYPVEQVASHEGWEMNPTLVTNFYNMLRDKLWDAQPNEGHRLIKELEKDFEVCVITQNVDNLHEKAGSSHVIHLHGELTKVCSSSDKENIDCIEIWPLDNDIRLGDKAKDGSQLRPYIVWFGEPVPNMPIAMNTAFEADIFVVIGTSLLVSPANTLTACSGANHNIVIDPGEVEIPEGFLHIKETATIGMEMLYHSLCKLAQ